MKKLFGSSLAFVFLLNPSAKAATDLTEVMNRSSEISNAQGGQSTSGLFQTPLEHFSITDSEMITAPAFHAESPRPTDKEFSVRHVLTFAYGVSSGLTIAPVLDLSQLISGEDTGKLSLNDPQLKFSFKNFFKKEFMSETIQSGLLISLYAPASEISRAKHSLGAISVSFTPRIQFRESRFALSGLFSLKNGVYGRTNANALLSSQGMTGFQGNYRVSPRFEAFVMNYVNFKMGARIDMTDAGFASQTFSRSRDNHIFALMTGLKFDATADISITPRFNWYLDQPIEASTLGLNVMIRLI